MQNHSNNSNSDDVAADQAHDAHTVPEVGKQILFPVSLTKLIVLDTLFFGIYAIFWMFKNWKYMKEKQGVKCLPWARAIFAPLYLFVLAPQMIELITKNGGKKPPMAPVALALIYFIGNFIGRFEHPACTFLALLHVVPLVLLQKGVNEINGGADAVINKKFSVLNWVFMVIGVLLWGLTIFSMFVKT